MSIPRPLVLPTLLALAWPLRAATASSCPLGSSAWLRWGLALVVFFLVMELRVRALRKRNRELEEQVAAQSSELEEAKGSLQGLNLTDPLTGLPNRRYLHATASDDVLRTLKAYRSLSLGMSTKETNLDLAFLKLQVHHFKSVNEKHGYAAGDQLILHYKDLLLGATRGSDGVVRWDDDHFVLIARSANRSDMKTLADRVCRSVQNNPFEIDGTQQIICGCNLGWAVFPLLPSDPGAQAWEQVLELADAGLEEAKARSLDWVGVLPESGTQSAELGPEPVVNFKALVEAGKLVLQTA